MSNDKEFDEWYYVTDKCDTRFDGLENQNAYYKCLETWNYQQKIIDKKNKEIKQVRGLLRTFYHVSKTVTSQKIPSEPSLDSLRDCQELYDFSDDIKQLNEVEGE